MYTPAAEAAVAIWKSGVAAVCAPNLLRQHVAVKGQLLYVAGHRFDLSTVRKIGVVGAGKAVGFMAQALEDVLRPATGLILEGCVNVPDNCVTDTDHIALHAARPAGINEPRPEGVAGAQRMQALLTSLCPDDLCICLISGGGSALLPAPVPGVSLADKLAVTRLLSAAGASIQELNRVRIELSTLKGGGLARACGARQLITLIISDILGDPLDLIASGPTVYSRPMPHSALAILRKYGGSAVPGSVVDYLRGQLDQPRAARLEPTCTVYNLVLANNATAVAAARGEAERRGFLVEVLEPEPPDTAAEAVGVELTKRMRNKSPAPICVLWGGEPVVRLAAAEVRGKGGRNQQLVLAGLRHWMDNEHRTFAEEMCLLSGGTDGEDGPTDAAGALVDAKIMRRIRQLQLDPSRYLQANDAYSFFDAVGGLLKTGPTQTNVCDLRVALF